MFHGRDTQSVAIKRRSRCGSVRGCPRTEFALLARSCTTSRAMDSLNLFESRLLGLHRGGMMQQFAVGKMVNFAQEPRIIVAKSLLRSKPLNEGNGLP
jgi:hypothetical protein